MKDDDIFDDDDNEEQMIVLDDGDGNETVCIVIDSLSHKGNYYMLVTPFDAEGEDDENFEATIFKRTGEDDGKDMYEYSTIEDENEFNEVATCFMENAKDYDLEA